VTARGLASGDIYSRLLNWIPRAAKFISLFLELIAVWADKRRPRGSSNFMKASRERKICPATENRGCGIERRGSRTTPCNPQTFILDRPLFARLPSPQRKARKSEVPQMKNAKSTMEKDK